MIFELDSEIVAKEARSNAKCKFWRLWPVIKDIRAGLQQIPEHQVVVIKRSANVAADWAAKFALKEMCNLGWIHLPPSSLVHILDKDGLPAPPL